MSAGELSKVVFFFLVIKCVCRKQVKLTSVQANVRFSVVCVCGGRFIGENPAKILINHSNLP